jgi:N-acetylglucosaminyldiphosphoundecaprenol N-acetyl-beta-D-mannosaminyltransferase
MTDRRVSFLDILFDSLTEDRVVADLLSRTRDAPFGYVVTPNVDHVVRLSRLDPAAPEHKAYADAGWCLCDSRTLSILAALRGVRLPVITGSDLTVRLFSDVLVSGDRICLIGGDDATRAALATLRPDIEIVQHIPPLGLRSDPEARSAAASFAAASGARFTLIAVGSPQQELIAQAMQTLSEAGGMAFCVGASIDFLTGKERRAPRWMQRASLEWLYRLLGDPARLWRRYLIDGPRIFLLAWRWKR